MSGQIENRARFASLQKGVEAEFLEVFDQTTMDYKCGYGKVFSTISSKKEREHMTGIAGPGELERKDEGENFTRAARLKLYDTNYIPVPYGKMIEATREEIDDNAYTEKLDAAKQLTRRGLTTKERHVWHVLNNAFSTSDTLPKFPISRYGDGVPMASTIHPRKDGGTAQSNASATGIPLTEQNLNVGLLALYAQLEDDGTPIDTMGRVLLVVPLALEKTALEITKSDLKSGTANNDMNYYQGVNFDVVSSKYLGATFGGLDTQWFLIMPEIAKLRAVDRVALEVATSTDPDNLNVKCSIYARWTAGYHDWRGVWGSKGDGAAYSS